MLEKSPQTVCKGRSESGDTQHPRLMAKGEQASGKHLRGFAHSLFGLYLVLNTLNMYNTHFKNNLSRVRNYFLNTLAVKACGNTTMRKRAIACKPEEVRVLWFGQARPPSGARGLQRPLCRGALHGPAWRSRPATWLHGDSAGAPETNWTLRSA